MPQLRRLVPQALPPGFRSSPDNPEEAEASLVHSRKVGFVLSSWEGSTWPSVVIA